MNDIIFYVDSRYLSLYDDYGVTLKHFEMTTPEVRSFECDVPFKAGLTDCHYGLTSQTIYENREAKLECKIYFEQSSYTLTTYTTLLQAINSRRLKFNLRQDYLESGFLYEGRVHVGTLESGDDAWTFDITIDTKPYATLDLPSGYTAYEGIQNTSGNSVLVLSSFTFDNNKGFRVKGGIMHDGTTGYAIPDGIISINSSPTLSFPMSDGQATSHWRINYPHTSTTSTDTLISSNPTTASTWVYFDGYANYLGSNTASIKWSDNTWSSVAIDNPTFSVTTSLRFMQNNTTGSPKRIINDVWITNGGTVTHHFIPVYRSSDSYVGLYDLINRTAIMGTVSSTGTLVNERLTRRL